MQVVILTPPKGGIWKLEINCLIFVAVMKTQNLQNAWWWFTTDVVNS